MRGFFSPNLNVPPEETVKSFSAPHLAYLACIIMISAAVLAVFSRASDKSRERCLKATVVVILLSETARIVWGIYHGVFTFQDWLPLHLCSVIIFTGPVIAWSKNEKIKDLLIAFTYGVSLPGAFFALMTPDKPVYSAFCFEYMQTMITHGAIVLMGIYLPAVIGFRPRIRVLPKLFALLMIQFAVCFGVNSLINYLDPKEIPRLANYMFLTFAPKGTPLELFEQLMGRLYIIPTAMLLFFVWLLLFIPWEIYYKAVKNV